MAWPPPAYPLDTNKVNSLAQINDHPDAHNDLADSINQIVPEVNTVRSRVTAVENALPGKASTGSVAAVNARVDAANASRVAHVSSASSWVTAPAITFSQDIGGTSYDPTLPGTQFQIRHGIAHVEFNGTLAGDVFPGGGVASQGPITFDATALPNPRFSARNAVGQLTIVGGSGGPDWIGIVVVLSINGPWGIRVGSAQAGTASTGLLLSTGTAVTGQLTYRTTEADT